MGFDPKWAISDVPMMPKVRIACPFAHPLRLLLALAAPRVLSAAQSLPHSSQLPVPVLLTPLPSPSCRAATS